MVSIISLSFISALVCTVLAVVVSGFANNDWGDVWERKGFFIGSFIVEFLWMMGYLYVSCEPQTVLSAIIYMWPALIVVAIIAVIVKYSNYAYDSDVWFSVIAAVISLLVLLSTKVGPVQNLIYKQDMENVDITYAVTSDEILAKVELKIDNSNWREKFKVEAPEMRYVNSEHIAVYHIVDDAEATWANEEYIPGYAIQKVNELPQIITKRIYFDISFINERDALRTIRRKYPTVIIGNHKFDIDDKWSPYEVYEYREKFFTTDGKDYGLIILNLMDGTCEKYPVSEGKIPDWVDFQTTYPR